MFNLYGDESHLDTAVTYALVIVPENRMFDVEQALTEVKLSFGGAADSRIHCRELFHPAAQAKTDWKALSIQELFEMFCMIGNSLRLSGASFRLGHVDMLDTEPFLFGNTSPSRTPTGPKQLATFAYMLALADLEQSPGYDNLNLWIDPDPTKIEWFGRRRQAGRHPISNDIYGPLKPQFIPVGAKPTLLDVADLLAFSAAHIHSHKKTQKTEFFNEAVKSFNANYRRMQFHPQAFEDAPWQTAELVRRSQAASSAS